MQIGTVSLWKLITYMNHNTLNKESYCNNSTVKHSNVHTLPHANNLTRIFTVQHGMADSDVAIDKRFTYMPQWTKLNISKTVSGSLAASRNRCNTFGSKQPYGCIKICLSRFKICFSDFSDTFLPKITWCSKLLPQLSYSKPHQIQAACKLSSVIQVRCLL